MTRYQFSDLLCKAWFQAMTVENVMAGFCSTGVYRSALLLKPSYDPASLPKKTALKYIPLYSPAKLSPYTRQTVPPTVSFTQEELSRYQLRCEEGFDLTLDEKYDQWLRMYHPEENNSSESAAQRVMCSLHSSGMLSKFLKPPIPIKKPTLNPVQSTRVLTSSENRKLLEEKEMKKQMVQAEKRRRAEQRELRG